jgi:hypothetical protein
MGLRCKSADISRAVFPAQLNIKPRQQIDRKLYIPNSRLSAGIGHLGEIPGDARARYRNGCKKDFHDLWAISQACAIEPEAPDAAIATILAGSTPSTRKTSPRATRLSA